MNDHALRLVYHKEVAVLINDVKRDVFGSDFKGLCIGDKELNLVPRPALVAF